MTISIKKSHDRITTSQDVVDLARQRIHSLYQRFDEVWVSFSGGKDSTACLNLTLEVARELNRLPLKVYTFDEEAIPPETVEYMERVAALPDVEFLWFCLPIEHRNACSRAEPVWRPWDPAKRDLWTRELPPGPQDQLHPMVNRTIVDGKHASDGSADSFRTTGDVQTFGE